GGARPAVLGPGRGPKCYVTTADGTVTVVDLVKLSGIARVPVGPGLSSIRDHPTRPEIWGVSGPGGYVWVLDAKSNQVEARIAVGPMPLTVDFSRDGKLAYTTSSKTDTLIAIDCVSRRIVAQAKTGGGPVIAHVTPDGKS